MFAQFQLQYPTGSLISELLTIDHGKYLVRVLVQVDGVTRATGMAAADTIESAEDRARIRALAVLGILASAPAQPEIQEIRPATNTSVRRPPAFGGNEPLFSREQFSSPDLGSSTPDTSWLNDSPDPSFPETTIPPAHVAPVSVAGMSSESSDWQRHAVDSASIAAIREASPAGIATSREPSSKVTPIGSRRHEPEITAAVQPVPDLPEASTTAKKNKAIVEPVDDQSIQSVSARIEIEMKRIGWTPAQGREYLLRTYNKKSRSQLNDEQLLEFLHYLEEQPSPIS